MKYTIMFTGEPEGDYKVMLEDGVLTKEKWHNRFRDCRKHGHYVTVGDFALFKVITVGTGDRVDRNCHIAKDGTMLFRNKKIAEKVAYGYYDIVLYIQLV